MQNNSRRIHIAYNGVEYNSLKSACNELGLNYNVIRRRMINFGLSFEEAINYSNITYRDGIKVTYKGVEYNSIKVACDTLGFNYNIIRSRMLKYSLQFEEAINYSRRDFTHGTKVMYKGVEYSSIKSACKSLGLNYSTIKSRIDKLGSSFEEVVNQSYNSNRTKVVYNGVEYNSIRSACKELGFTYKIITDRMRKHKLSFEDAVNYTSTRCNNNVKRIKVTYNGVEYNSIMSACKELGFNYVTVSSRMKRNDLSFEEAIADLFPTDLKDCFTINNVITAKEGVFNDCTCNKCNIRAILGVDTMRKHVEVCYAE